MTQRNQVTQGDDIEIVAFSSSLDAMRLQLLDMAGHSEPAAGHWEPRRYRRAHRPDTAGMAPSRSQVRLASALLTRYGLPTRRLYTLNRSQVGRIIAILQSK